METRICLWVVDSASIFVAHFDLQISYPKNSVRVPSDASEITKLLAPLQNRQQAVDDWTLVLNAWAMSTGEMRLGKASTVPSKHLAATNL